MPPPSRLFKIIKKASKVHRFKKRDIGKMKEKSNPIINEEGYVDPPRIFETVISILTINETLKGEINTHHTYSNTKRNKSGNMHIQGFKLPNILFF